MTAHDIYEMFVGEIGVGRKELLYELDYCDIYLITQGYRKRERTFCEMIRWSTFMSMSCGMSDLKKAGIFEPKDILKFRWEKADEEDRVPDQEEVERTRRELIEENRKNAEA